MRRKAIFLLFLALGILTLCSCNKSGGINEESDELIVAEIDYEGNNYKIKSSNSYGLELYKNNEFAQGGIPGTYKNVMISEPNSKESVNIEELDTITQGVADVDLGTGYKYINYLRDNGYNIEFKARTYKFLEYYLKNDEQYLKRVIITPDYTVISDVDKIPELNIRNYIF